MADRERLPIGIVVPSSNTACEPESCELARLVPRLSLHFSRVPVTRVTTQVGDDAQFGPEPMTRAAALLADAGVRSVAWAGTAGSWLGLEHERGVVAALEAAAATPATTSTLGLLQGCRALGVRRVGLVTPYVDDVVGRICANYEDEGLTVASEAHLGITDNRAFGDVGREEIAALVRKVASSRPDAVMIVCTNLRGSALVRTLEAELDVPVLDSIAATVWHAAAVAGEPFTLVGSGVLLGQGALRGELLKISERLVATTRADRATVRVEVPAIGLSVDRVAAETVAPGTKPIARDDSIMQWKLPTIRHLQRYLVPLAQENAAVEPGIPPILSERYGVRSQLLGPLEQDGQLAGWLSLHSRTERSWDDSDLAALGRAASAVACHLDWQPPRWSQ